jgi:hypothetical protein
MYRNRVSGPLGARDLSDTAGAVLGGTVSLGTVLVALGGTFGLMTDSKWLTWALDQARRDLIDLTRRNRLLHAPLEGKRPWCMAISGYTTDELFEKLYRQENFRGYPTVAEGMEFAVQYNGGNC